MSQTLSCVTSADDAYAETLRELLEHGRAIVGGESKSVGAGKETKEILNFSKVITSPTSKAILNPARRINVPAAVARFLWMMAGSDRLADIAFYEPKVAFFSDDGISVPGSSYGQRILRPRPGLNQLVAIIERLRKDPQSRRAAMSVYQPEDAVRESKDIPCVFGVAYHVRENQLHATTMMRSNNAFILMPYNIFEFGLLAEVVAAELGIQLGSLTHHALSMHLYESDYSKAQQVVDSYDKEDLPSLEFPPIPTTPSPLEEIRKLAILEADLRHGSEGLTGANIEDWIRRGQTDLDSYWAQLYFLLLFFIVQKKNQNLSVDLDQREMALASLKSVIEDPWTSLLPDGAFDVDRSNEEELAQLELPIFGKEEKIIPIVSTRAHKQLRESVSRFEESEGDTVSWKEFVKLEEKYATQLAARDGESLTVNELTKEIARIRADD